MFLQKLPKAFSIPSDKHGVKKEGKDGKVKSIIEIEIEAPQFVSVEDFVTTAEGEVNALRFINDAMKDFAKYLARNAAVSEEKSETTSLTQIVEKAQTAARNANPSKVAERGVSAAKAKEAVNNIKSVADTLDLDNPDPEAIKRLLAMVKGL